MAWRTLEGTRPEIIAHRGASGLRPEHSLAGYALALAQGADVIEPDLVPSRDGVLHCRHEQPCQRRAADGSGTWQLGQLWEVQLVQASCADACSQH